MSLLNEIIETAEQGSDFWNKIRIGKITGSKANDWVFKKGEITKGAMTYVSKRVAEILTGVSQESSYESEAMMWGTQQEPFARKLYFEKTGLEVTTTGFVLYDEFSGCSPDGLVEPDGIIEIKCPNTDTHVANCMCDSQAYFKKNRPEHYWQVMANLFFTGRSWAHFISYDPRLTSAPLFVLMIKRDDKDIAMINSSLETLKQEIKKSLSRLNAA